MVWRGRVIADRMPQNPAISVFLSDFISADTSPQNKRSLMFQHRWIARSILIAGLVLGYAQQSWGETFTGEKFLAWKTDSQSFYLNASINMAGVIAAQKDGPMARCVDAWHIEQRNSQYQSVISHIRQNSSYHPQGVLFALLRRECGLK